jgi:hypothetical protein
MHSALAMGMQHSVPLARCKVDRRVGKRGHQLVSRQVCSARVAKVARDKVVALNPRRVVEQHAERDVGTVSESGARKGGGGSVGLCRLNRVDEEIEKSTQCAAAHRRT